MTTKEFWIDLLERSVATFAEAMLGFLTIGMAIEQIDWLMALSVSGVAVMVTVLKCFVKVKPSESVHFEDYSDIDKTDAPSQ